MENSIATICALEAFYAGLYQYEHIYSASARNVRNRKKPKQTQKYFLRFNILLTYYFVYTRARARFIYIIGVLAVNKNLTK